jgi:hypothetical protein
MILTPDAMYSSLRTDPLGRSRVQVKLDSDK